MAPVSFGGIVSGIDTQSIVDQIIAARSAPIQQLGVRIGEAEARKTAVSDLRGTLSNLLAKVKSLTTLSTLNKRAVSGGTAAISTTKVVSATADSTAAVGAFTVTVEQLATTTAVTAATPVGQAVDAAAALNSAGFATTITTGTFTINGVQITIDDSTVLSDGVDDAFSNSILGMINNAGVGVTAAVVNDSAARPNLLQLTAGATITLGAGNDTSNFLGAAHLLASPAGTTRTSTRYLGQTQVAANLQDARLTTALSASSGSFKINGVAITYDAQSESLNNLLTKINNASAGVSASYDGITDTIQLTAQTTGSTSIALEDVTGNFLAAAGLLGATAVLGANAAYTINGGATQYASSNTINDAVAGVTLTLKAAAPGDIATITVTADDDAVVSAVKGFVEQYNSTLGILANLTLSDPEGTSGVLASDSAVRGLQQTLRSIVVGFAENLTGTFDALGDLGLTFGSVGAALGATSTMVLNESDLRDALVQDRNAVVQVFAAHTVSAAFTDGAGSLSSVSGSPTSLTAGTYTLTDDGAGNLSMEFVPNDGSATVNSTGTITAGGTNSLLIPGMTLTAANPLTAGTDTIVVTRDQAGIAVMLDEFIDAQLKIDGALDAKTSSLDAQIKDMNERMARLEDRLTAEQTRLERRFAAMEQIFARFQQQQSFLTSLSTQLTAINKRR